MCGMKLRMNRKTGSHISGLIALTLGLSLWLAAPSAHSGEQKFDTLQVGTQTYKNVTVTTKSKNYVFILHSQGMTSLKLSELPGDVLTQLGYQDPSVPKVATNGPAVWAKQTVAKLDSPEVKKIEEEIKTKWNNTPATAQIPLPEFSRTLLLEIAAVLLLIYLFNCYCCKQICVKAGTKPGLLIWVPGFQLLPMLTAAGMSRWWFLAFFVPVLNFVAHILWCFKLADARGKTALVGFLFWFPPTSFIAFLYLAFSNGSRLRLPGRQQAAPVMTLETA